MNPLISFFFLALVIPGLQFAKLGPYYAEPYGLENLPDEVPGLVTSYFYLQQMNQNKVIMLGDMEIKEKVGPLMASLTILPWAGKFFKRTSGPENNRYYPIACQDQAVWNMLNTFGPKELMNKDNCTLDAGKYAMVFDFDKTMHLRYSTYPLQPLLFTLRFLNQQQQTLFGFSIYINVMDLKIHEFASGRGTIPQQ